MKTSAMAICVSLLAFAAARAQDKIDRLDMQAHTAFSSGDYDTAIKLWSQVITLDPKDGAALCNRAAAYTSKNDPDKALEDYNAAILLDPTDADTHQYRADIYKTRWYAAAAKGDADQADADKMLADYAEVIRLKPSVGSYITRAQIYRSMYDYDKAAADWGEVIRLDTKTVQGYTSRANLYISAGEWDKAIADCDQIIHKEPDAYAGYQLRARAYYDKGDFDKALADSKEAIDIEPGIPNLISQRGNIYSAKGMYDKAFEDFNNLMTTQPNFAEGYNAAAWLYATCPDAKIRNGAKALELAKKACELTQWKNGSFLDTMAAAEAEAGDWDDAVKYEKQALEAAKTSKQDQWEIKGYNTRVQLYGQKQPYRAGKEPSGSP